MRPILWMVIAVALSCSTDVAVGPGGVLMPSVWGGDRMMLIVTQDSVTAGFDCAAGWLDAPIRLDAARRFDVGGHYQPQVGPWGPMFPARYAGVLGREAGASSITLAVTVSPPSEPAYTLGPYHLIRGKKLDLFFCD